MRAGAYNNIIHIYKKVSSVTEYGTEKTNYINKTSVWANIQYISGGRTEENNEYFFGNQVNFTVRYYVEIDDEDRIYWNGKMYRILNVQYLSDITKREKKITAELIND
jgi:SPP1 family predicted phage head-tail adaptor